MHEALPCGIVPSMRGRSSITGVGSGSNAVPDQQRHLRRDNTGPSDLKRIYLTHHHSEHAGGLSDLLWWAPHAELWTSRHEARIISGRSRPDWLSNPLFRPFAAQGLPTVP